MPIPKHLRHFYRGKDYRQTRVKVLDRAGNACEQCKAPNRTRIWRVNLKRFAGWWWGESDGLARDPRGNVQQHVPIFEALCEFPDAQYRGVKIVLTIAHLNRTPGDDRMENLKALCQWCHLNFDMPQHLHNSRETRCTKKDAARPLLAVREAS